MRPQFQDRPPENEKAGEELSFLPGLDLKGTLDKALAEIRDSYKRRFDERRFCVYEHRLDGEPFYVGMGQEGDRAFRTTSHRNHNRLWRAKVGANGRPEVVILKDRLTLEEARREEQWVIKDYQEQGLQLVNIRRGGEIPSYLTAWKISRTLRLHSACQKVKRMTEAASMHFKAIQGEFAL